MEWSNCNTKTANYVDEFFCYRTFNTNDYSIKSRFMDGWIDIPIGLLVIFLYVLLVHGDLFIYLLTFVPCNMS